MISSKKLNDFLDEIMLLDIDRERILVDQMIPSDRKAL